MPPGKTSLTGEPEHLQPVPFSWDHTTLTFGAGQGAIEVDPRVMLARLVKAEPENEQHWRSIFSADLGDPDILTDALVDL